VRIDEDYAVTFWHALRRRPESDPWSGAELAAPLKAMHDIHIDDTAGLPRWEPFAAAQRRLAAADPALPPDDLAWLHDQWNLAAEQYRRLPPVQLGLVHGDAHAGNLLRPQPGSQTPVLADLDSCGIGPVSWDLAVPALDGIRFGEKDFYVDFAAAYGRDVTESPEWPVLRRIRELLLATSAIPDLSRRPAIAAQHAHRLATLRAGHTDAIWRGYT
jgi:Ser/Thr protein kinase RdoA (MazF antagonist)